MTPLARTKIVATLGPACARKTVLREMIQAGVDVFRLNFSHGTPAAHLRQVRLVREVAAALGSDVSILGDLTGPKIRLGHLPKPVCVRSDQRVVLTVGRRPAPGELPVTFRGLAGALEA
ncbi:pyruvate kinase, partial [Candidatus Sumerlaeota bacterium]|nr:pyruvate kinase [Candidatus Sumerlaeota bacterium]